MKFQEIKNQKGAITLVVLISILFFTTFLTSTYIILSNKAQTQIEITKQIKNKYKQEDPKQTYNKFFGEEIIPIYNVEQLLNIGSGKNIPINETGGKIFKFSNTATYTLMNNISFSAIEWEDLLNEEDWVPINSNEEFEGNFEGNGKKITVTNLDNSVSIYSTYNNYEYMETI